MINRYFKHQEDLTLLRKVFFVSEMNSKSRMWLETKYQKWETVGQMMNLFCNINDENHSLHFIDRSVLFYESYSNRRVFGHLVIVVR